MNRVPLSDNVVLAIAHLVDDAQGERRDPSHSEIDFEINKAELSAADPKAGPPIGKAKKVRMVLTRAMADNPDGAERFAYGIICAVTANGGFRKASPNFVGEDRILNLSSMLKPLGVSLDLDGSLAPMALEGLSGELLTEALAIYVARAKRGIEDAALLTGTGKDLMEAVAAHVVEKVCGRYDPNASFPMLLGQAFTALGMGTTADYQRTAEHPRANL